MKKDLVITAQSIISESQDTQNALVKAGADITALSDQEIFNLIESMMNSEKDYVMKCELRGVLLKILKWQMNQSFQGIDDCREKLKIITKGLCNSFFKDHKD